MSQKVFIQLKICEFFDTFSNEKKIFLSCGLRFWGIVLYHKILLHLVAANQSYNPPKFDDSLQNN